MQASPDHSSIDDLRLSTLLGTGRHGSVFLGRSGSRSVAVKVPMARSSREAAVLSRFGHENIVSVIGMPLDNGTLVLEHCAGGTLADLLAERPNLDSIEVAAILLPIIGALSHIHDKGWIHGDIAPSNIAFREDGTPVLIDFATARPADSGDIVEGNPAFLGPLRQATSTLDVRSLAATAMHALGELNRWDHEPQHNAAARRSLTTLVDKADSGAAVELVELEHLLNDTIAAGPIDDFAVAEPLAVPTTRFGSTGSTRSFGPRPGGSGSGTGNRPVDRRLLVLVASVVAIVLIGYEAMASRSIAEPPLPGRTEATSSPEPELVSAEQTIDASDAEWDASTGMLTRMVDGEAIRWRAGRPGDLAAIADWNCSGFETLGIYRPASGSWFTFGSWAPNDESSVPVQLPTNADLFVETQPGSTCATVRTAG